MKILLACSAGMSTSLLVNKMIDASKAEGRDDKIWAVGQAELEEAMKECDVLLLGPQMRFLATKIQPQADELGIPMDVIPATLYGRVDGKAVLDFADELAL